MKSKKASLKLLYTLLALLLLILITVSGRGISSAYAVTGESNALKDLQTDSSFNIDDYPDDSKDTKIYVIQIAESTDGNLYVYTYQPCQKTYNLTATEINMSLSESAEGTKLYGLTLVNISGVFGKYKVRNFVVSRDEVRYYNITSIYREWRKGIDEETGNGNIKNAVAFAVGKLYKATTENGDVKYDKRPIDVIEIRSLYAGFIRYRAGFWFHKEAVDSHYVAFKTDKKIDNLYEAELEYSTCPIHTVGGMPSFGDKKPQHIVLTAEEEYHKYGKWWLKGESAEYNRVQTVKEFIANEEIDEPVKKKLNGLQWVLRFSETDYSYQKRLDGAYFEDYTRVSDVTILRLKFKSADKVYNLGAVSDKVTGPGAPSNTEKETGVWEYVWNCIVKLFKGTATLAEKIVAVVAIFIALFCLAVIMLILSIFFPVVRTVLKTVFNGIWIAIKYLFICLWYVISSPVRLIIWIVRKCRGE